MGSRGSRTGTIRSRVPLSSIQIDGEDYYKAVNGVRPGSVGRSRWTFSFGDGSKRAYPDLKYSEAKRQAKKDAQATGQRYVRLEI